MSSQSYLITRTMIWWFHLHVPWLIGFFILSDRAESWTYRYSTNGWISGWLSNVCDPFRALLLYHLVISHFNESLWTFQNLFWAFMVAFQLNAISTFQRFWDHIRAILMFRNLERLINFCRLFPLLLKSLKLDLTSQTRYFLQDVFKHYLLLICRTILLLFQSFLELQIFKILIALLF